MVIKVKEEGTTFCFHYEAEIHGRTVFLKVISGKKYQMMAPRIEVGVLPSESILGVCGNELKCNVVAQWIDPNKYWLVFTQKNDFWTVKGRFNSKAALIFWARVMH